MNRQEQPALPEKIERIPLMGLGVDSVTMEQALRQIDCRIHEPGPHQVVTLDASMCVMAQSDLELAEIVRSAALVTPDSSGVVWAVRKRGYELTGRVSGVEIVERLCQAGHSLFFLGAAPGVALAAGQRMMELYPQCTVVGTADGYFKPDEEPAILEAIRSAKPELLCVAMGIPKQEKWIARHMAGLGVPVSIGVGGTFDVLSGGVRRAPMWVQRANLEWLYRLAKNPRKIGKTLTLPRFVLMAMRKGGSRK